ncbi:MAG: penicillin acylase family protein [Chloroflexi bacterium]|nr:penicillin acylase family protein [Chloroflexota bacterium]MYD48136.1 penicillin acylase family protein [Chloroflexota bacterium]
MGCTVMSISAADLKAAVPPLDGEVILDGLHDSVSVWRDAWGIPHVQAANEPDAWFAQGFVTAQDRLWAMEYDRRRAVGRWAEVVGRSAVGPDLQIRRHRLEDAARADYAAAGPRARLMLDAYAAGVNAFINSDAPLPAEYAITGINPEPWEPWHGLAIYKVRHIFMGVFESKAWRARMVKELGPQRAAELFPSYPPGQPVIIPTGADYDGPVDFGLQQMLERAADLNLIGEMDSGSNSWVISGQRTATGKPILAGDSHRGLDTPSVYYQNHLACDTFNVIGVSFAGLPGFPHFGHNGRVAWCVTHTAADYQDLYIERFNDADASLYQRQEDWYNADVRDEVIKVAGEDDVHLRTWETHHGPVVAGDPLSGYGVSLRYTAGDGADPWTDILCAMLDADSVHELTDAMQGWVDPVNNFVMADSYGNIGYQCRGEIPRRPGDVPAPLPVPGWDGQHEWQGSIPFDKLPRSINPPEGYIATANNRPVGADYPYYISMDFAPGYRAMRVAHRIKTLPNPSANDMGRIHSERISLPAQTYVAALSKLPEPSDAITATALRLLSAWDGSMDVDAVEPTIYSAMRDALLWRLLKHNIGEQLAALAWQPVDRGRGVFLNRFRNLITDAIAADDTDLLPDGVAWPSALGDALAEGARILTTKLGPDPEKWRWNKVHRTRPQHPLSFAMPELSKLLDPPRIATGGDGDTPWAGSYSPADFAALGGMSVFRYAYDPADWDRSLWAVPLGSSGHPVSRHYADQAETWGQVRMIPMLYGWERIATQAITKQTLQPA